MDGYIGFHAALRHSYNCFIRDLAKECKQLVRHHLDSVTSPYSQVCYESDFPFGSGVNPFRNPSSASSTCLQLSEHKAKLHKEIQKDQENVPPQKNAHEDTTPGKLLEAREAYMTVPETPSPDQPSDGIYVIKKEHGNYIEGGAKKRHSRIKGNSKVLDNLKFQSGGGNAYSEICLSAAQHFARIREVLIERSVTSALNSGFLTPWYATNDILDYTRFCYVDSDIGFLYLYIFPVFLFM